MTMDEVLSAFKEGRLTTLEVRSKLRLLKLEVERVPLSEGQKGLFILHQLSSSASEYNVPVSFRVDGELDRGLFQQACEFLLAQYPILGARIRSDAQGELFQELNSGGAVSVRWEDASSSTPEQTGARLRGFAKETFDLERAPLMRVQVASRSASEHFVLIVIHHIVFDGSSVPLLVATLLRAYDTLRDGQLPAIAAVAGYRDFVEWERGMLSSEDARRHRSFWASHLSGELPTLSLPRDGTSRGVRERVDGNTHRRLLDTDLIRNVKAWSAEHAVSPAVVFLTAYTLLLHRYTRERDIIVGIPTAGRPAEAFEQSIGYFVNMMALRTRLDPDAAFAKTAEEIQLNLLDAMDHASYPFARVVRDLNIARRDAEAPVFQVAFEYQSSGVLRARSIGGPGNALKLAPSDGFHQEGEYELALEIIEEPDGIAVHLKYDRQRHSDAAMARMCDHFVTLLRHALDQSRVPAAQLQILTPAETGALAKWNLTAADYASEACLHELFEAQARRTPDAPALTFGNVTLSYADLHSKADELAAVLQAAGVGPGSQVPVCMERSIGMVVALLGTLKAGAAYVPIDPNYPGNRISYLLDEYPNCRAPLTGIAEGRYSVPGR